MALVTTAHAAGSSSSWREAASARKPLSSVAPARVLAQVSATKVARSSASRELRDEERALSSAVP